MQVRWSGEPAVAAGSLRAPGDCFEVEDAAGASYVATGRATVVELPAEDAPAQKAAKAKPVTPVVTAGE